MKIKNIMLITFLLLAVLTIGAVSASDDIALDNVTASDDADALSVDDEDDPYFDYDLYLDNNLEDICIDPNNENGEYNDEIENIISLFNEDLLDENIDIEYILEKSY